MVALVEEVLEHLGLQSIVNDLKALDAASPDSQPRLLAHLGDQALDHRQYQPMCSSNPQARDLDSARLPLKLHVEGLGTAAHIQNTARRRTIRWSA